MGVAHSGSICDMNRNSNNDDDGGGGGGRSGSGLGRSKCVDDINFVTSASGVGNRLLLSLNSTLGDGRNNGRTCVAEASELTWLQQLAAVKELSVLSRESFDDRLSRYLRALHVDTPKQREMVAAFVDELEKGLECHVQHPNEWVESECSFKMLDAFVPELPTGKEKGIFYALDFGGTNFRAVRACLHGDGTITATQKQKSMSQLLVPNCSKGLLDARATASQMFDFFAQTCEEFVQESGDGGQGVTYPAGFTFSFPCTMRRIDCAILMNFTKGFETGRKTDDPVEGLDVCELMNVGFMRNNSALRINSLLNDTVGTLLACAYERDATLYPPVLVGLILGTGMNAAYYEPKAQNYGYRGKLINIECGNFNRNLPHINVDCELDFRATDNRGQQHLEKMCSGAYLGEIAKTVIVRVFQHRAPAMAYEIDSFPSSAVATIMADDTPDLTETEKTIYQYWHVRPDRDDRLAIHKICVAVMDRSAALAAVVIAGCAVKTGRLQPAMGGLSVGIDGTLYKKNPWYQQRIRQHLDSILGKTRAQLIHLLFASDGSGKGAAVLAATVASRKIVTRRHQQRHQQ